MSSENPRKFALHGLAVQIECQVGSVAGEIRRALRPFEVGDWPEGFAAVQGVIRPYQTAEICSRLSASARPTPVVDDLIEMFQDQERFWRIDDRVGLVELNLLKNEWTAWLTPAASADPIRCLDVMLHWPLAQLLRPRGLSLLPAISIERDGWGALIFAPYPIEAELVALVRAGYRLVGQRWTALREEAGRMELLHMPGQIERTPGPAVGLFESDPSRYVDLTDPNVWAQAPCAACATIIVIPPGRRQATQVRHCSHEKSVALLRHAWPCDEVPTNGRRPGSLLGKLAQKCQCAELQLSRRPDQFLSVINTLRLRWTARHWRRPATTVIQTVASSAPSSPSSLPTRPPHRFLQPVPGPAPAPLLRALAS